MLPSGPLRALYFGSEFCQDLLPDPKQAEAFCALAHEADLEAVLLTPMVRANGLQRISELLTELKGRGWAPAICFNDWGVLRMLRTDHPENQIRAGRLLNRALRDPRLAESPPEPGPRETARGGQIRALLLRSGVAALESDPDLEGSYLGAKPEGLQRTLHLPYAFAVSGRNCLFKAETQKEPKNFAKWLGRDCPAPCRGRWHPEERADLGFPLWRAGNTLFYEVPPARGKALLDRADRIVIHERPMP